jgi:8-oxo-dGTP diphosphatase
MRDQNLYLVRHAKAGSRSDWSGDDTVRPLSKAGRKQAVLLADTFVELKPPRLLSSPFLRCMQTLEPTAERVGIPVEPLDMLAEGGSYEDVIELLATLPPRSVLCSHGDVIPAVLAALERRGMQLRTVPDWRKGATWVLERADDGTFTAASAWPPPREPQPA